MKKLVILFLVVPLLQARDLPGTIHFKRLGISNFLVEHGSVELLPATNLTALSFEIGQIIIPILKDQETNTNMCPRQYMVPSLLLRARWQLDRIENVKTMVELFPDSIRLHEAFRGVFELEAQSKSRIMKMLPSGKSEKEDDCPDIDAFEELLNLFDEEINKARTIAMSVVYNGLSAQTESEFQDVVPQIRKYAAEQDLASLEQHYPDLSIKHKAMVKVNEDGFSIVLLAPLIDPRKDRLVFKFEEPPMHMLDEETGLYVLLHPGGHQDLEYLVISKDGKWFMAMSEFDFQNGCQPTFGHFYVCHGVYRTIPNLNKSKTSKDGALCLVALYLKKYKAAKRLCQTHILLRPKMADEKEEKPLCTGEDIFDENGKFSHVPDHCILQTFSSLEKWRASTASLDHGLDVEYKWHYEIDTLVPGIEKDNYKLIGEVMEKMNKESIFLEDGLLIVKEIEVMKDLRVKQWKWLRAIVGLVIAGMICFVNTLHVIEYYRHGFFFWDWTIWALYLVFVVVSECIRIGVTFWGMHLRTVQDIVQEVVAELARCVASIVPSFEK